MSNRYSKYPQTPSTYIDWVEAIKTEASDKLNGWETDFIASIDRQLCTHRPLSQGQAEKLEDIYAAYTE